jgi:outer membrane receptor protein involved in Fe transport
MKKLFVLAFAMALLLVSSSVPARAQGLGNAQLNGTVTDPSGGSISGATITLRNPATDISYSATSNASGYYAIANLQPGTYELKASFAGFANYTQTGIVLTVGQVATINLGMQLESQGEKVVVTTEEQVIEPTKTEISSVVGETQIQELPTSGRLFTDFALLTPGVSTSRTSLGTTFTEYEATQISFGGMRAFSNEITVDGADFVNTASGIQRSTPPQESVQEFRVVNNSFGAEYGRAIGGIVNIVTKGGTNDFHGSAYEYFQNNALDSANLLQKPEPGLQSVALPDTLQQNQFGATLGGPIQKDKTFFFINYEGKRRAESPLFPPDLVTGNLAANSGTPNLVIIDEAKALMGLAPEGCTSKLGLSGCDGGFPGQVLSFPQALGFLHDFLKTTNNDYGFARVDHQFNASNRLAIRYNAEDARDAGELVGQTLDGGGIGVPSGGRDLFIRDQSLVGTLDTTLTPTLVNTFLAQYARRHYNFPGMTGQPDFSILNDLEIGHNFGTNDRLYESRVEAGDSLSWVKGNHVAKFGFDGNYLWSLENFPGFMPVRMLVPGVSCLANFAEFYNGPGATDNLNPTSAALDAISGQCPVPQDDGVVFTYAGVEVPASRSFTSGPPLVVSGSGTALNTSTWANAFPPQLFNTFSKEIDHGYWGFFAQDQWRINPKLTVNLGLRWDYESGLAEFVKPDYGDWQPRVGIAWSPNSKTVVRAGFGMFDDRYNLTFFFVPNTQKVVPGLGCSPQVPPCLAGGAVGITGQNLTVLPQMLPMTNLNQTEQGYQIFGFPAGAGAAGYAASVIQTGGYTAGPEGQTNDISLVGTCDTTFACGVGAGGMDHNVSKTPYAEQASAEVDHQFGHGMAVNAAYLFVGAHRLVRGNNINVPCPLGTTDPSQEGGVTTISGEESAAIDTGFWPLSGPAGPPLFPDAVPGLILPNGKFSKCASGTPTVLTTGALAGLGPWFAGAGPDAGLQSMSYGLLDYNNGVANAAYHGGTLTFIERVKWFNMTANYTYSHTIDNGNFTTFINLPPNQFDYKSERANSNQDARHRLVTNFTALGPDDTFLRHFTLSSIITLQSGRPFTIYYGSNTLNDVAGGATDRVGGAPVDHAGDCTTTATCATMIPRNTYIGDPLYSWDLHLARYFQLTERLRLETSVDAFNLLNRSNVDEVTSVYGSPVFCGSRNAMIPRHYRDAVSRAIQSESASQSCPVGDGLAISGVGSFASTPITLDTFAGGGPTACSGAGANPNPLANVSSTCLFIPSNPNSNFGLPRTMLNPRQFQFAAKFTF